MERISVTSNESEPASFEVGSGNVYADLGYDDPEEMAAKAHLVRLIRSEIEGRQLTQVAAASLIGIDQPTLSKLLRGIIRKITIDRLSLMLRRLGRNVIIFVEPQESTDADRAVDISIGHVEVRGVKAAQA